MKGRVIGITPAVILLLALAFRLAIAFTSTEGNDDHTEVIQLIREQGSFPKANSCWECFQPPLFYLFHAALADRLGNRTTLELNRQMQWFNWAIALLTAMALFIFIREMDIETPWKWSLLAFFLLNPSFVSMSVQPTNDSLIFLLGSLFILWSTRWIRQANYTRFALTALCACLAACIKGHGLLLLVLLLPLLALKWRDLTLQHKMVCLPLIPLTWILAFGAGGYYSKYTETGDPFITNMQKTGPPPFWHDEEWFGARAGIRSVRSGYFTFLPGELYRTPYQINDEPEFPRHRTSFFTLLYANFYHAQFANHPASWQADPQHWVHQVGRILFITGLIPLAVFLAGLISLLYRLLIRFRQCDPILLFHLFVVGTFFAFLIKYSFDYRDFAHIKVIFLFPAMLSLIALTNQGFKWFRTIAGQRAALFMSWYFRLVAVLFSTDLAGLLQTLFLHYQGL